ncbi:coatomer subunit delta [Ditylenchus destructor]|uniref:Coatomer subunit delta n=1 Tax=Ditylenchus destructor TaxID=166010 RepID=A0AAD4R1I3_9BILA|nr:coatomer subunit delta [Ditylenchus destructor]
MSQIRNFTEMNSEGEHLFNKHGKQSEESVLQWCETCPIVSKRGIRVKQYTFVEMDIVRFLYQTVNNLYVVLLTKKHSNILQYMDSLRIFSHVVS